MGVSQNSIGNVDLEHEFSDVHRKRNRNPLQSDDEFFTNVQQNAFKVYLDMCLP